MSGIKQNSPIRKSASGTATITAYTGSVTVTHNLGMPTKILSVESLNEYGIDKYLSDITDNAFTINLPNPNQPMDADFKYSVAT